MKEAMSKDQKKEMAEDLMSNEEKKKGTLESMNIDVADNGYIVRENRRAPRNANSKGEIPYSPPQNRSKVFASAEDAAKHVEECLKEG